MTDFSDGVEQNRQLIRGNRSQVTNDKSFLNACHDGRVASPQRQRQGCFRTKVSRKRRRNRDDRSRYGLNRSGAAPQVGFPRHGRGIELPHDRIGRTFRQEQGVPARDVEIGQTLLVR